MNALELDREALEFAAGVCTPKQMEVLRLRAEGHGYRVIARQLLLSPASVKDRCNAGLLHLQKAILEMEAQ